jgi:cell division protein FtsI (penicillin-binding protein 3)
VVANPVKRQRVVSIALLILLLVFAARLVDIQVVRASELSDQALQSRLTTTTLEPQRADILASDGTVLATSVNRYNIHVNQKQLATWKRTENGVVVAEGPLGAARILAPILGMSESELAAQLVGDKSFVYIAKNVTPEVWGLVNDERVGGIDREPTSERLYPNGNIAGNVVGFMAGDATKQGLWGQAGIEKAYESELLGAQGSFTFERGAGGYVIPTGVLEEEPAVEGSDVMLTINRDLQWYTQQRVQQALNETGSSDAIIVVTSVKTGEILALVDSNPVDPTDPGSSEARDRGSRAVSTVFEPGSTAKIITVAAALEEGLVTPTTEFIAPYQYTTSNGETFKDSHDYGDQKLTTAGILVASSNTGTVQIGEKLSSQQRYVYLTKFGLGSPANVGMPGESGGILRDYQDWDGRSRYAVLFGQALSVTAVQTNQVYAAIANGGVMQPTTVVKGLVHADGSFTPRELPEPHRVVSEKTAAELMLMLEAVTEDGTGVLARIEGYRVAGKTGTAQAADATGALTRIVSSFVGVAPADDPEVVVSVIMFDPKSSIWGGEVAAPVFKDVTTFALQALRVAPSGERGEMYPTTWE